MRAMIEPASMPLAAQKVMRREVRDKSLAAYGRLTEAHMLATGAIGSALWRVNYKRSLERQETTADDRSALIASFVIGLDIIETAITEGCYLQAATILRQEMETLAALDEIDQRGSARKDGSQMSAPYHQ